MPARLTALFGLCALAHVAADGLLASPWLVPDLTLIGMALVVAHRPSAWWAASLGAGVLAAAWAARFPHAILALYLSAGWGPAFLGREWDLTDARLQGWLVAALSAAVTCGLISLDGAWSWGLAGRWVVRTAVTVGAWALVRPVAARLLAA